MKAYIVRRLFLAVPVVVGVSVVVFALMHLVSGDVVLQMLQDSNATVSDREKLRQQLGLDKPLYEQYFTWVWNALQGDLGRSLYSREPVTSRLLRPLPVTSELALLAFLVAMVLGLPIGVLSAVRQDSLLDYALRGVSILGLAMPTFWVGTLVLVLPALWFNYAPPFGYVSFQSNPMKNLQQFAGPALVLGFALSASITRMTRSAMLEVLRQDYIRTAWSKGLQERIVVFRHGLKNALIPTVSLMGVQFGYLLTGTVVIEIVFALPGLGRLTVDSIIQKDYTQVQANVLFISLVFVLMNLVVDLSYAWLEPRIKYR